MAKLCIELVCIRLSTLSKHMWCTSVLFWNVYDNKETSIYQQTNCLSSDIELHVLVVGFCKKDKVVRKFVLSLKSVSLHVCYLDILNNKELQFCEVAWNKKKWIKRNVYTYSVNDCLMWALLFSCDVSICVGVWRWGWGVGGQ